MLLIDNTWKNLSTKTKNKNSNYNSKLKISDVNLICFTTKITITKPCHVD